MNIPARATWTWNPATQRYYSSSENSRTNEDGKGVPLQPSHDPQVDGIGRPASRAPPFAPIRTTTLSPPSASSLELDPEFKLVAPNKARSYFTPGRVFKMVFPEPAGTSNAGAWQVDSPFKDTPIAVKVKWFVVLQAWKRHCLVSPISTYRGQGLSKHGLDLNDHAALVLKGAAKDSATVESEQKDAIHIIMESSSEKIHEASFIDFSRIFTLEYQSKVKTVGRIAPEDIGRLKHYSQQSSWKGKAVSHDGKGQPPLSLSNVPFRRDPDFVGRDELLSAIDNRLSEPGARVALVGLGGIGKSQIAIEYAHRRRERFGSVLWLRASSEARFEESIIHALSLLAAHGQEGHSTNLWERFSESLHDDRNGQWLLVLDNIDDAGFLFESRPVTEPSKSGDIANFAAKALYDYIPVCDHVRTMITTRSRTAASQLVENRDIISVLPMNQDCAVELLARKLPDTHAQSEMYELVNALECMPLAITQAAAYIARRAPRSSIRQYLERLQSDLVQRVPKILEYDMGDLRRDREAQNSILSTWQISFEHIRQEKTSAADLLSLISFFDCQEIQEFLLRDDGTKPAIGVNASTRKNTIGESGDRSDGNSCSEEAGPGDFTSDDEFDDDIETLMDYSFISTSTDVATFTMHRLVQLATQRWLRANGQLEQWERRFIETLNAKYHDIIDKGLPMGLALYTHAKMAVNLQPSDQDTALQLAEVLYNAGCYALRQGEQSTADLSVAELLSKRSTEIRMTILGKLDRSTLNSFSNLASLYQLQGRLDEAMRLQENVLAALREIQEVEYDTVISMSNLAWTYRLMGKLDRAEELLEQVNNTCLDLLGETHPDTLRSMRMLALVYLDTGRFEEAESMLNRILSNRTKVLGANHPDTLTSMHDIALNQMHQGLLEEANDTLLSVLERRGEQLGENHLSTLMTLAGLATIFKQLGRLDEASEFARRAWKALKKVLGAEHPQTLQNMSDFAHILKAQGADEEADTLLRECALISSRVLGVDHPNSVDRSLIVEEWANARDGTHQHSEAPPMVTS